MSNLKNNMCLDSHDFRQKRKSCIEVVYLWLKIQVIINKEAIHNKICVEGMLEYSVK